MPVDQAFGFDFSQQGHQLTLSWKVKDGYYLYRQQFHISAQHAQLAPVTLPPGQPHEDEFYGKSEIYPQDVQLPIILRGRCRCNAQRDLSGLRRGRFLLSAGDPLGAADGDCCR